MSQNEEYPITLNNRKTYYEWGNFKKCDTIILAVHGYNDYGNAFEIPARYLSSNKFCIRSFDLNGFGKNENFGTWYPLELHIKDVKNEIDILAESYPDKDFFLLGESMGGAIVLSLAASQSNLNINGIILVAPAIWNFTERNFFKSKFLGLISYFFPRLSINGKGWVKVKASDNQEMLKTLAKDPYFVHNPNLQSLYGIIELMDQSYEHTKIFLTKNNYPTLLLIPIKDEIVPRKPLIELLKNSRINEFDNKKIDIKIFESSFHMMLRDLKGNRITNEIKDWIINKNNNNIINLQKGREKLENSEFFHMLD